MAAARRLRRAPTIHAYWKDGDLVFENFVTRIAVSADPIALTILSFFDDWRRQLGVTGTQRPLRRFLESRTRSKP